MKLEIHNLKKSLGDKKIFNNFSYQFSKGCYAIVGPNGIGKSTLLEILAGVKRQDDGSVYLSSVGSNDSLEYKRKLTYVPSKPMFYPSATGKEFLSFISSLKNNGKEKSLNLDKLINDFNISRVLSNRFDEMSLGTQKKLFLCTLAISHSEIIILDEPTNALDRESNQILINEIRNLEKSSIIILATHNEKLLNEIDATTLNLSQLFAANAN